MTEPATPPPGRPANVTCARDHFAAVVEAAIAATVIGDPISYDLAPALFPAPGTGAIMVVYVLILSCRSPLLSPPRIAVNQIITDGHPSDAQLQSAVTDGIASLFEVRRRLTAGAN